MKRGRGEKWLQRRWWDRKRSVGRVDDGGIRSVADADASR